MCVALGAGVLASAAAMDKDVANRLLAQAGLPMAASVSVSVDAYGPEVDYHLIETLGLHILDQGMKVAVEVVMQAVEVGFIEKGDRVIGIGGTSRGSDVAIVARAAGPDNFSDMWVSEILAKPL